MLRRASKLILGISNFSYAYGLRAIDVPSTKYNRIRGEMIHVYNIFHGEDESLKKLFNVGSTSITRGSKSKLKKPFVKGKIRKHFFSIRMIAEWNRNMNGAFAKKVLSQKY